MAESAFAKRLLEKQGWKEGDGLGKKRNGIAKPIKVTLKMDKTGVGHDPGTNFTDHWWLKVFNDAANSIAKEKTNEAGESENQTSQSKLYKGFVKGSILSDGKEEKDSDCDSEDESEDMQGCGGVPTLDDIHKYCGGATGHRAATLGIKMKGKLSRAAEHERLFNEKLNSKTSNTPEALNGDLTEPPSKKKKKQASEQTDYVSETTDETLLTNFSEKIKGESGKRRKKNSSQHNEVCDENDECKNGHIVSENISEEETSETHTKKSKKKKKHKEKEETFVVNDESQYECVEQTSDRKRKKSKRRDQEQRILEDDNVQSSDLVINEQPKHKKKKKKHRD